MNVLNQENILTINNMSGIQRLRQLLQQDIQEKGVQTYQPKVLRKGGILTAKAKKFNQRMIREGKMTKYIAGDKFYNAQTQRFVNKPIDKRSGNIKQSFLNKNTIFGDTFVPKKQTLDFRYVAGAGTNVTWNSENDLYNNGLLRKIIIDNGIQGSYRIIINRSGDNIFDSSFNIDSNFWKNNAIQFQVDSANMIWNNQLSSGEVVTFVFTKETLLPTQYYQQSYLDGVNHCFFSNIINWAKDVIEGTKSKSTIKKYQSILNKIIGKVSKDKKNRTESKQGYLEQYKKGIPESKIGDVCEDLQIGVTIDQPFSNKILYEYRSNKKPLKIFRFLNTRLNHIESNETPIRFDNVYKCYEPTILSRVDMTNKLKELNDDNQLTIYSKDKYGVKSIRTLDCYYALENKYQQAVSKFEKESGLKWCSIDAKKYPLLQKFIDLGTHFNGTIDFVDTSEFKEEIPSNIEHIDMTKAYTQFKKSKYYCGFMGKITDFRKVDNYDINGMYFIKNIDFSRCNQKFVELNDKLGWFYDGNVYTKAELHALKKYGGKFDVLFGAFGTRFDFDFNDEMTNTKELIEFNENEFKISYYCKWAGMNCRINESRNFFMRGDINYFKNLNTKADVFYCDDGEAKISYPTEYRYNKKHITAQITAYQRLHMLEQLMNMNLDKLVRVCVDGIYYLPHHYKLNKCFSKKTRMTFGNDPCVCYLSNLINTSVSSPAVIDAMFEDLADHRPFYRSELFNSAGGNGKTYYNLIKENGFINTVYVPHSHKLSTAMIKEYKEHFGDDSILRVSNHSRILSNIFGIVEGELFKHNVYVIDECSMLTEHQKQFILKHCLGKVIFLGDLDCQALPVINNAMMLKLESQYPDGIPKKFVTQMNSKGIDNVDKLLVNVNYRFKDEKIKSVIKTVRENIRKKIDFKNLGLQMVDNEYVKKNYKKEDIILVSRGSDTNIETNLNNQWTDTFKDIQKFRIMENTKEYKNGEIVFEDIKGIKRQLRHGYTIHSVQGETFKNKIFIDMRYMTDNRLFYTAISRANYWTQIFLIYN